MRPADTRFTTEAKPAEPRSTRKSALFRAAALATTMLCPGLAAPAFAQTADVPQARVNLDENGVDVATGKFHYQTEEGAIGSGSDRITIQRAWNAAGWQDNIVGTLRRTTPASGQRRITMEFGLRSISFIRTGSGAFVSESGEGGTLTEAADGASYTYTAANGSVYHYGNPEPLPDPDPSLDDTKFCTSTSEAACFALPLTRQSSDGLLLNFQWDVYPSCKIIKNTFVVCTEYARLERVFDNAGLEAEIDYVSDATYNNRPVAEWYKRSKVDFRTATNATPAATIGYAYPDAVTTQVTGPDNGVTVYKQDGAGRLASIQRPGETTPGLTIAYQTDNRVSQVTRDGVIKSYSWSTYNGDTVLNTSGGPNGPETIVSNPNLKQPKTTTDANGAVLSHQYDSFGRVSLTTYPEGNSVGFAYDSRGNVTQTTYYPKPGSGLGNIVVEAGYSSGCPDMDTCNSPLWTDDADDNRTDYTYDATHGQVTKVERPAPAPGQPRPTTNSSYTALYTQYRNANGTLVNSGTPQYKPTLVTSCATAAACPGSADETRVTMEYNHPNLYLTKVTTASGDGSLSASTEYSYDRAGRVSIIDGPLAGTADRIYQYHDDKSRLIGRVYPDPDGAGPRQRRAEYYAYRQDGQRQSVKIGTTGATDLTGITVANELVSQFDAQGRKTHDRYYAGSAATGTLQSVNQYSYDANGRLDCSAQRMNPASWSALPASACTLATTGAFGPDRIAKNVYDAAGRVISVISAYGTAEQSTEQVAYTPNGQAAHVIDAELNRTSYGYDGHDRLAKTFYPVAAKGANASSTTDYEQLTYDALGNVTQRRVRDGQTIGYGYDDLGRLVAKDLPGGEVDATYAYDLYGRLTSATQGGLVDTLAYDALNRMTGTTSYLGSVSYLYDAAGRRTRTTYPGSGLYVTYDHDALGNVTAIRENGATSGVGVLASYAYDDLARRSSVTFGNGTVQTFAFDGASRLASLGNDLAGSASDLSQTFAYNPAGQIASATRSGDAYAWAGHANATDAYAANGLNQLTQAGTVALGYDARGNLTSSGSDTFTYTAENFLLTGPGGVLAKYDPLGRLWQVEAATGVKTRFGYDGLDLIGEYSDAGVVLRRYVHGPGIDQPIVWYEGSGTSNRRFLMADERGSIVSVTDGNGAVVGLNSYDEYGIPAATNIGRFGYTGQTWIAELGLWNYKARMYSPTLGRFMQTDPIGYGDGLNWYNYVGGDPVNFVDPLGLVNETFTVTQSRCDGPVKGYSCGEPNYDLILILGAAEFSARKPKPQCPAVPPGGPGEDEVKDNIEAAEAARKNMRESSWSIFDAPSAIGAKGAWFIGKVKTGGPWDYKNNGYSQGRDFGNFNYGATAAALGFDWKTTKNFAHLYSLIENGESESEMRQIARGYYYSRNLCDLK